MELLGLITIADAIIDNKNNNYLFKLPIGPVYSRRGNTRCYFCVYNIIFITSV